ncbi:hypothetical protein QBC38DRAFT_516575 [Podospora fimiseda]|uniref:Uncharacterized protein n=1 Tax=Podospora fimiseda TaxID=252190 RepID=A0AAN7BHX3_9PEZI|nr:hypothetical protein QBC38DRAFT_516575 [Podospora fimiseda]
MASDTAPSKQTLAVCELCEPLQFDDAFYEGEELISEDGSSHLRLPSSEASSAENGCLYCGFLLSLLRSSDFAAVLDDVFDDLDKGRVVPFRVDAHYRTADATFESRGLRFLKLAITYNVPELQGASAPHFYFDCAISRSHAARGDDVASWLRLEDYLTLDDIPTAVALDWAKRELLNCDGRLGDHHMHCGGLTDPYFLPTRLVQIDHDLDVLRLVSGKDLINNSQQHGCIIPPAYTALSYCWGKTPSSSSSEYMTTSTNEHERRTEGIRLSQLPAILQDFI